MVSLVIVGTVILGTGIVPMWAGGAWAETATPATNAAAVANSGKYLIETGNMAGYTFKQFAVTLAKPAAARKAASGGRLATNTLIARAPASIPPA